VIKGAAHAKYSVKKDSPRVKVTSRYWERLGEEWTSPVLEYDREYSSIFLFSDLNIVIILHKVLSKKHIRMYSISISSTKTYL
jgi:hypothetical protein